MQDIFAESGLSAGAVYSHFTGKEEIITAIAEDVIDNITTAVGAALPGDEAPSLDETLDGFFTTLQRLDIAPIAVIVWAQAIRDPALSRRLSGLYRGLADHLTKLVRIGQAGGSIDPSAPAKHTAVVLTALGPAFLHQLAFGPGIDAAAFNQGLRALMRG